MVNVRSTLTANAIATPQLRHGYSARQATITTGDRVEAGSALQTEAGRFQTETLPGTATEQPGDPTGGPIDCSGGMDRPSLSLDVAGRAEIYKDLAEK